MKTKKTAGTSIEIYFETYCMAPDEWHPGRPGEEYASEHGVIGMRGGREAMDRPTEGHWWNHMPARQIRDGVGDAIWSAYFRFATIRNPFDKAVSAYFHQKQRGGEPIGEADQERAAFQQWLETVGPPLDRDKYMLANRYCLSDVIRYESLLNDLERICARLGIPFEPWRLPREKTGFRPAWATCGAMYLPPSRAIVEQAYAFELGFFGYQFPASAMPDGRP